MLIENNDADELNAINYLTVFIVSLVFGCFKIKSL